MTSPIDLRDAIVAELITLFPDIKRNIEEHDGRIDATAIKSWIRTVPAIRVAVLGSRRITPVGNGQVDIDWNMNAFVVEKDSAAAAALATAIIVDAEGNHRGLENVFDPKDMRCDNLHAAALEKHGVTIWVVAWTQRIRTGVDALAEDGTIPDTIYASRSPDIGAAHKQEYRDVDTMETPDE